MDDLVMRIIFNCEFSLCIFLLQMDQCNTFEQFLIPNERAHVAMTHNNRRPDVKFSSTMKRCVCVSTKSNDLIYFILFFFTNIRTAADACCLLGCLAFLLFLFSFLFFSCFSISEKQNYETEVCEMSSGIPNLMRGLSA